MPETPIPPALTAEEWNPVCPTGEFTYTGPRVDMDDPEAWIEDGELWLPAHCDGEEIVRNRHGLAALALHDQPFGFTHEDVVFLRGCAEHGTNYETCNSDADQLRSIADRLAALLPPK